jgi:hypothetical protein
MLIVIPALGAALATFCIWLTVRVINRKERWATRAIILLAGMPLTYALSLPPAAWLVNKRAIPLRSAAIFYNPILRQVGKSPEWIRSCATLGNTNVELGILKMRYYLQELESLNRRRARERQFLDRFIRYADGDAGLENLPLPELRD